jgi:hypothetical protein
MKLQQPQLTAATLPRRCPCQEQKEDGQLYIFAMHNNSDLACISSHGNRVAQPRNLKG